jgi:hypothetical protein
VAPRKRKRLIVPIALAVTAVGTIAAAVAGGCGSDPKPTVDAAVHDANPDTPIV